MNPQLKRSENLKCRLRMKMVNAEEDQDIYKLDFLKTCLENLPEMHPILKRIEKDRIYSKDHYR